MLPVVELHMVPCAYLPDTEATGGVVVHSAAIYLLDKQIET